MTKTLYKRASNGKIQKWTIEVKENKFRTIEGYVDGEMTCTAFTDCIGKSQGTKKATTSQQQAIKEAEARVKKQIKKGWTENIDNVDQAALKVLPMLAKKFEEVGGLLEMMNWRSIYAQPKLDGIRCLMEKDGTAYTKSGLLHNNSFPHINKEVRQLMKEIQWSEFRFLDGELYNHDLRDDFNKISSIVRKKTPSKEELEESERLMKYYIYDINLTGIPLTKRLDTLYQLKKITEEKGLKHLVFVETSFHNSNIDTYHRTCILDGYEGSMWRRSDSLYESKRTKNLIKKKDFIDDEFEIIDILQGKGNKAGMAATAVCKDARGETFDTGIIGDNDYCISLLKRKNEVIGKMGTVKYQNLTPDRQVPRFGKLKAVRDYE